MVISRLCEEGRQSLGPFISNLCAGFSLSLPIRLDWSWRETGVNTASFLWFICFQSQDWKLGLKLGEGEPGARG